MTRRLFFIAVAILVGVSADCRVDQSSIYHLSFRTFRVAPSERVSKFDLHLRPAMIVGFRSIPVGWQINIDNDPSWITEVSGIAVVGTADPEEQAFRPWFLTLLAKSGEAGPLRSMVRLRSPTATRPERSKLPIAM
jgi:hypothetical protein